MCNTFVLRASCERRAAANANSLSHFFILSFPSLRAAPSHFYCVRFCVRRMRYGELIYCEIKHLFYSRLFPVLSTWADTHTVHLLHRGLLCIHIETIHALIANFQHIQLHAKEVIFVLLSMCMCVCAHKYLFVRLPGVDNSVHSPIDFYINSMSQSEFLCDVKIIIAFLCQHNLRQ